MKYAVIGSNGYIGGVLCSALRTRGIEVIEISSSNGGINPDVGLLPSGFEFSSEIDAVFFLAQSPYYRAVPQHADHLISVNCVSAVQAATAAVKAGVKNFVYASTGNVYCSSFEAIKETNRTCRDAWYPLSKLMAEDALGLFKSEMNITSARIFGTYGPGQSGKLIPALIEAVRERKPILLSPHPDNPDDRDGLRVSFMYVDDLVNVFMLLAEHPAPPQVINVAGDRAYSLKTVAGTIGKYLGIEPNFEFSAHSRQGDWIADIGLMRTLLDYELTSLDVGVSKTLGISQE